MAPTGWLDSACAVALETTGACCPGESIEPRATARARPIGRFIFTIGVNYLRPHPRLIGAEPRAIRRSIAARPAGLRIALGDGVLEVEVHRKLRERGASLAMAEDAVVEFQGGGV